MDAACVTDGVAAPRDRGFLGESALGLELTYLDLSTCWVNDSMHALTNAGHTSSLSSS